MGAAPMPTAMKPPTGIPAPGGVRPRPGASGNGTSDPTGGAGQAAINPWYVVLAVTGGVMMAMVLWRGGRDEA